MQHSSPGSGANAGADGRTIRPASRSEAFLARVDAHISALTPQNAAKWLAAQLDGWEARYARFLATSGASEPVTDPADPPQAVDFLLTIGGLTERLREACRG